MVSLGRPPSPKSQNLPVLIKKKNNPKISCDRRLSSFLLCPEQLAEKELPLLWKNSWSSWGSKLLL